MFERFSLKNSAWASAAGTVILNVGLNVGAGIAEFSRAVAPSTGKDPAAAEKKLDSGSVILNTKEGDTSYSPSLTWEGLKSPWLITTVTLGATTEQKNLVDVTHTQAMRYAKKFSDDPNARIHINPADILELRNTLGAKLDEHLAGRAVMYTPISRVIEETFGSSDSSLATAPATVKTRVVSGTIYGSASFEGNAKKGDASVAENSVDPENESLASVRAEVARLVVVDLLIDRGFDPAALNQALKVEAGENQPGGERYQQLTEWAIAKGLPGDTPQAKLRNAINGFNSGTLVDISSEERALFKESLDDNRYGKVSILLEQQVNGRHVFSVFVCFIPWFGRSQKEEEKPTPQPIGGPPPPPTPEPVAVPIADVGPKLLGIGDGPPKLLTEGTGKDIPALLTERYIRKAQQQRDLVDIDLLEYLDRHPVINYRVLISSYQEEVNVQKIISPLQGMNKLTQEILSAWNVADSTNHFDNESQKIWAADHAARLIELSSIAQAQDKDLHVVLREEASAGLKSFVDNKLGRHDLDLYDSALASIRQSFVDYYDLILKFQDLSTAHGDEVAGFKTATAVLAQWENTDGRTYFNEPRQVKAASAHADVIRSVVEAGREIGSDDYLGILRRLG